MKKLYLISLIIAAAALFFGCKKDDNEPEPQKEEPKIQYDSSKVVSLLNTGYVMFNPEYNNPKLDDKDCRCFSYPLSIGTERKLYEPIEIKVLDTLTYTYRYQLANYSITDAAGENMALEYTPDEATNILLLPHKELKSNTQYTLKVTLTITQLINGEWQQVVYKGGTVDFTSTVIFTTGELPGNTIDAQDILFQYPIDRQLNYLTEEYKQGYIMLSYNYKNIFDNTSDEDKKIVIKSVSDASFTEKTIKYTVTECHEVVAQDIEIDYSLENIQFNSHQIYSLDFYCKDNIIYTMYFRTSKYPNAKEKLKNLVINGKASIKLDNHPVLGDMLSNVDNMEFDLFELPSNDRFQTSLIALKADLDNCEWYQKSIYKLLYDSYPLDLSYYRICKEYPPVDAMCMNNSEILYQGYLSDNDIENKNNEKELDPEGSIGMKLLIQMHYDVEMRLYNLQQKDCDAELDKYNQPEPYTVGSYPYYISYRLPGKNIITYTEKHALTVE